MSQSHMAPRPTIGRLSRMGISGNPHSIKSGSSPPASPSRNCQETTSVAVAPSGVFIAVGSTQVKKECRECPDALEGTSSMSASSTAGTGCDERVRRSGYNLRARPVDLSVKQRKRAFTDELDAKIIFKVEAVDDGTFVTTLPVANGDGPGSSTLPSSTHARREDAARRPSTRRRVGRASNPHPSTSDEAQPMKVVGSRTRTCEFEGCPRRPSFGYRGQKLATRCAGHKAEGQVDVTSRRCAHPGCFLIPSYRHVGEKGSKFCAAHKEPGMEDYHKVVRRCWQSGCNRNPSFGFEGCKKSSCAQHRADGMINLNVVTCRELGCKRTPNFGLRGSSPSYCGKHKKEGMVNVVSRRCEHPSCERIPSYGVEDGRRKASFCKQHKTADMVNVRHRRCAREGCTRQPGFGVAGRKMGTYCKEHKEPFMVDVVNKCRYKPRKRVRED